jgi:hypothetical protein
MAMTNIDSRIEGKNEVPGSRGKIYTLVALFFAPLLLAFLL